MDMVLICELFMLLLNTLSSVSGAPAAVQNSEDNLPRDRRPLPIFDANRAHFRAAMADSEVLSGLPDHFLKREFPGQFFTEVEINNISRLLGARHKRELDGDLCCRTDLWFGSPPAEMTDAETGKKWPILKGGDVYQAYSRGDCRNERPYVSRCPAGGECRQKKRLLMLWVQVNSFAELRYFRINSHCAYENAYQTTTTV